MIIIADSGSTKTSWIISEENGKISTITTNGINPFFRTPLDIFEEVKSEFSSVNTNKAKKVFFYGAGVVDDIKRSIIYNALNPVFTNAEITIESDLSAAARATLGKKPGIACILGTGANSCFYNGAQIIKNIPPLGYILGDEGSGTYIGKKLVADYLKGILSEELQHKFRERYSFSYSEFLENIYKKERPNRFLGQFVPFVKENISDLYCKNVIETSFSDFIKRNVLLYPENKNYPICFVGSVAFHFEENLKKVLQKNNLKPGIVLQEPMPGLINFHLNQ